jgi:hypothetical protein
MRVRDLTGQKFGRLLVVSFCGYTDQGKAKWQCHCDCGNNPVVIGASMKNGRQVSCGFHKNEICAKRMKEYATKHGLAYTAIYRAWKGLLSRCYNPNSNCYPDYGGRGITACAGIRTSVVTLLNAVGHRPESHLSLDRKNNSLGYWCGECVECVKNNRPMNLRWGDDFVQCRNQRTNRIIKYNGESKCVAQWAEDTGITQNAIKMRLDRLGWSVKRTLTTPLRITKANNSSNY